MTLIRKGALRDRPTRVARLGSLHAAEADLRTAITGEASYRPVVLRSAGKWTQPESRAPADGVVLGDLAKVRRGIATGCNAFFVLSEARRQEFAIDGDDLLPCIASPRHFAGSELQLADLDAMNETVPRWLLRVAKAPRSGPLARYLRQGRTQFRVQDRTLTRQRVKAGRKWFQVELIGEAPILFRYLNASPARFVRNHAGATPINNWLVIQPKLGVDPDALFRVLREASGSSALRENSRHYGKGLWKLEPSELHALALPATARALMPSR